jgi:hypothetical protein
VFKTIRKNPQSKRLRFSPRISWIFTVGKHTRQFSCFGDPSAVVFQFEFNCSAELSARLLLG